MSESTYNQRYSASDSSTAGSFLFHTVGGKDAAVCKVAYGDSSAITPVDATNPLPVTAGGAAHDAALSGNPVIVGGYASAAAPTSVSGDGDAVRAWFLRNGAQSVVVTAAGALIGGDAANGLDVDVTRLPAPLTVVGGGTEATALRITVASDSTGVLSIDDNGGSITVDGSVTAADSQTITDNAAFTDGTTKVFVGGYIYDEVAGTALTENDAVAARVDVKRAQVLVIEDETTRGRRTTVTAGNALKVDNSAVTQPVNLTQYLGSAASATNPLHVTPGSSASFTVAQATASSLKNTPDGGVAHDAADSGNPIKIGGKARTAHPSAVANSDRADLYLDDLGRPVVVSGCPRDLLTHATTTITSSTAETTVLAAGGAGVFHDVVSVTLTNSSATATEVTFKDDTGGTTRFMLSVPANDSRHYPFSRPVNQAADNDNWTATCADSAASIIIFIQAEKNV